MKILENFFYAVTAVIVFVVYLFTIAPSVVQIDSGELAAVQATLGIAHPTGYPLFTIAGYLFSLIPLPFTKIFQLNLLAAIYCSAAVGIFTYTIKHVLDNFSVFKGKRASNVDKSKIRRQKKQKVETVRQHTEISESVKIISAVFGGLVLAFSKTFWFQSTSVEVYSLHLLLISAITFILIKAYILSSKDNDVRPWLFFAVVLALGFTNHMTTLLLLPGTAYLYFSRYKIGKASLKRVLVMIIIFLTVLILVYAYLPIRASQNPLLNWGNPVDLERIMRHISGKQYQVWIFSSMEAAKKQFIYFIEELPLEFYFTFAVAVIGLFYSYLKAKKLFLFLIVTFLSTLLYSINYDIHDIDSYFLLAFVMIAFFSSMGAVRLFTISGASKKIVAAILGLLIAVQIYFNFDEVDQSNIYTFEDYTKELIGSVPENAIVFSYQWDFFISQSYYFQFVEGYRTDVKIVDKELIRRSWYFNQMQNYDSTLFAGVRSEVEQFLIALQPFERGGNFDPNRLENLYRIIMTKLITTNIDKRDFYIAPELFEKEMKRGEFTLPPGYNLVPDIFLFKVVKGTDYEPAGDPDFKIRFPEKRNYYIDSIERFVGSILSNRAIYEMNFGKIDRAKIYAKKIVSGLPNFRIPQQLQQIIKN